MLWIAGAMLGLDGVMRLSRLLAAFLQLAPQSAVTAGCPDFSRIAGQRNKNVKIRNCLFLQHVKGEPCRAHGIQVGSISTCVAEQRVLEVKTYHDLAGYAGWHLFNLLHHLAFSVIELPRLCLYQHASETICGEEARQGPSVWPMCMHL